MFHDRIDNRTVKWTDAPPRRIGEEAFREMAGNEVGLAPEMLAELFDGLEFGSVGKGTGGIYERASLVFRAGIVSSPPADRVKVFQGESEGIDLPVTFGAGFHFAMLFQLIPNRFRSAGVRLQGGNDIGRGRSRCSEDVFQQVDTAHDRGSLDSIRADGENRSHSEQAAPFPGFQLDPLKVMALFHREIEGLTI